MVYNLDGPVLSELVRFVMICYIYDVLLENCRPGSLRGLRLA